MGGSFGALLRAHRQAAGLTQEGLAELAALSGQTVGALERGDRRHPHRDTCHARALDLSRSLGMRYEQAEALIRLGDTHLAMGRPDAARTAWRSALEIMVELDHPDAAMARECLARP